VPFFSISGSDFVEMSSASVRRAFATCSIRRRNTPPVSCLSTKLTRSAARVAGPGRRNDEREQTLNQLLVEMDGLRRHDRRYRDRWQRTADVLDPALLRARQVRPAGGSCRFPTSARREQILLCTCGRSRWRRTSGGNHRARTPASRRRPRQPRPTRRRSLPRARTSALVDMDDFERAKDKIVMGASAARCYAGRGTEKHGLSRIGSRGGGEAPPRPIR